MEDLKQKALQAHKQWKGKVEVISRAKIENNEELSIAYTPGVAEPCIAIQKNPELSFELTRRWNTVAVITDGTAILGLGDIGPEAGMPVMEGKAALFKCFADIDAIPLCVRSKNVDEIVNAISLFSGSFGGINLEDISAPRCFEIEQKLKEVTDIPIFHDDQHGTAVVVFAGLKNALRIVGKKESEISVVISGAGSAGTAISKLLLQAGIKDIVMVDRCGAIHKDEVYENVAFTELAQITNPYCKKGSLAEVIKGADVFIGVSAPKLLTAEMIATMAKDPIVFAMANPIPEILPHEAKAAGARIACSGRSDYPNQINNVLAFPGIFRGALDVRAKDINEQMKLAAAYAIADLITKEELNEDYVIPSPFDKRVVSAIAKAVSEAAICTGVAKI
ncbi:malic enzyme-like NAD(P)-binding protein [Clostridium sp. MD294]|uniref:NAD(P)-dependent malic enzyme n=1 Tax=Clostridium sp. MD294 TaxID=97138 RepID=UPI0002CC8349|nr:malic enzyme-like NAD(P)-binding protein [Clostridium sp. MD294]NDO45755.1 malate dehydrogenase [Clostridium sp. MD294]USF30591.1 NAD-dependent malic enzyme [Clostridium sp. MD294]